MTATLNTCNVGGHIKKKMCSHCPVKMADFALCDVKSRLWVTVQLFTERENLNDSNCLTNINILIQGIFTQILSRIIISRVGVLVCHGGCGCCR